jgi:hypothetical protein
MKGLYYFEYGMKNSRGDRSSPHGRMVPPPPERTPLWRFHDGFHKNRQFLFGKINSKLREADMHPCNLPTQNDEEEKERGIF